MTVPMERVVFDTNTVLSGFLWSGPPFEGLQAAREKRIQLVSTEALIAELLRVLSRDKFKTRITALGLTVEAFVADYRALVEVVEPAEIAPTINADPTDEMVLACAIGGHATLVISGDKHLLNLGEYANIPIQRIGSLLERLNAANE